MSDQVDLALVLPCFNEEHRAPWARFRTFLENDHGAALLLVDDGSTDGTVQRMEELAVHFPTRVVLLKRDENGGKAEAVRQGTLKAAQLWPFARHVGYFDADLATPLEEARMLQGTPQASGPTLVMGSRVKLLGSTTIRRSWLRHYFGRVFATATSLMLGIAVYDTQCGAKLMRTKEVPWLMQEPFLSRWLFDVELIWRCLLRYGREDIGAQVQEVPLRRWEEMGNSRISFGYLFKVPMELLRIQAHYRRKEKAAGTTQA